MSLKAKHTYVLILISVWLILMSLIALLCFMDVEQIFLLKDEGFTIYIINNIERESEYEKKY